MGLCTLKDFTLSRLKKNIPWQPEEILYITHTLLNFVVLMGKNKMYHGDIKP
mgnify:CR=1 FL=1